MKRYVGIDLSTKTGLIILDGNGEVEQAGEITSKEKGDLERMIDITERIIEQLDDNDIICLEGFSYNSRGRGVSFQFGIGYIMRYKLIDRNYLIATPGQVKKFATGKGNASKDNMILPIYKRWGFENESDNVRDAYVLAQIARGYTNPKDLTKYQEEVIKTIEVV